MLFLYICFSSSSVKMIRAEGILSLRDILGVDGEAGKKVKEGET